MDQNDIADGKIIGCRKPPVGPGLKDTKHNKEQSGCRKDSSGDIKARFGALYTRISDPTAEINNQCDNQDLQDERSAPADRTRNETADQWSCCGSDPGCCADDAKRFGT